MKKTNDNKIQNIFRSKKFIAKSMKDKTPSLSFTMSTDSVCYIVSDSVVKVDGKLVDVHITVDEGDKYYFGDIN